MGFTMTRVVGVLTATDGAPVAGALVTASLSEAIHNGGTSYVGPFSVKTSSTGRWSLDVPAVTDEGTSPAGAFYTFACTEAGLNSDVIVPGSGVPLQFAALPVAPSAAGEVASVFGRTGKVEAEDGDYTAAQVTGALEATQAANVPAITATPAEIVESLVEAGIMAGE